MSRTLKAMLVGAAVTLIAVAGLLVSFYGLPVSRRDVDLTIADSRYCSVDEDCVLAALSCPLHSEVVNARELQKVLNMADRYTRYYGSCVYGAMDLHDYTRIRCQDGDCMAPLRAENISRER